MNITTPLLITGPIIEEIILETHAPEYVFIFPDMKDLRYMVDSPSSGVKSPRYYEVVYEFVRSINSYNALYKFAGIRMR